MRASRISSDRKMEGWKDGRIRAPRIARRRWPVAIPGDSEDRAGKNTSGPFIATNRMYLPHSTLRKTRCLKFQKERKKRQGSATVGRIGRWTPRPLAQSALLTTVVTSDALSVFFFFFRKSPFHRSQTAISPVAFHFSSGEWSFEMLFKRQNRFQAPSDPPGPTRESWCNAQGHIIPRVPSLYPPSL